MDVPVTTTQTSFSKELADISDEMQNQYGIEESPVDNMQGLQSPDYFARAAKKIKGQKHWFDHIFSFIVMGLVAHENIPVLVSFMDDQLYHWFQYTVPSGTIPFQFENSLLLHNRAFKVDEDVCKLYKYRKVCIEGLVAKLEDKNRGIFSSMLILQGILLDKLSDPSIQHLPQHVSIGLDLAVRRTMGYAAEVHRCEPQLNMIRLLTMASENIPLVFALCCGVQTGMDAFSEDSLIPSYIYRLRIFEEIAPKFNFALLMHARSVLMKKTSLIAHGSPVFDPDVYGVIQVFSELKFAYPKVQEKFEYISEKIATLMTSITVTMGDSDKSVAGTMNVYIQLMLAKYCLEKISKTDGIGFVPALADVLANLFAGVVHDKSILRLFTSPTVTKHMITARATELVQLDTSLPYVYHMAVEMMREHVPVLSELFIFSHVALEQHLLGRSSIPRADINLLTDRLLACSKLIIKDPTARSTPGHIFVSLRSSYAFLKMTEESEKSIDASYNSMISKVDKFLAIVLENEMKDKEKRKDEWVNPQMAQFLKKGPAKTPAKKKANKKSVAAPRRPEPLQLTPVVKIEEQQAKSEKAEPPTKEVTTKETKKDTKKETVTLPQSNVLPIKRASPTPAKKDNSPPLQSYIEAIKTPELPKAPKKPVNPAHTIAMLDVDDYCLLEKHDSRDIAYAYLMVGNYIDATYLKPLFAELSSKYADLQHVFKKSIIDFERELKTFALVKPLIFESALTAVNIPNFKFLSSCLKVYSKRLLVSHAYVPSLGDARLATVKMIMSSLYETKEGKDLILKNARKLGFKEDSYYTPLVPFTNVSNRSAMIPSCDTTSYELGLISLLEFFGTEYNAVKSGGTGPIDMWETRNKLAHRVPKTTEMKVYITEILADSDLGPFLQSLID